MAGPRHRAEGQPNQDAWLAAQGSFGSLTVVCDGLGSRPDAAVGARIACVAVRRAVARWPGAWTGADPVDLIRLIEALWRLGVRPQEPDACASTCRFALLETTGTLVTADLGDGVTLLRGSSGDVAVHGQRDTEGFGNETLALGVRHRLGDWRIAVLPPQPGRCVVLATDGIADDLRLDALEGFVRWLAEEIAPLPPRRRGACLRKELHCWPVPHHTDDKTLAVMIELEGEQR